MRWETVLKKTYTCILWERKVFYLEIFGIFSQKVNIFDINNKCLWVFLTLTIARVSCPQKAWLYNSAQQHYYAKLLFLIVKSTL